MRLRDIIITLILLIPFTVIWVLVCLWNKVVWNGKCNNCGAKLTETGHPDELGYQAYTCRNCNKKRRI